MVIPYKHVFLVFSTVLLGLFAQDSFSWSGKVHTQIGASAFELLSKKEQKYFEDLAQRLGDGSFKVHNMSAWVDSVRSEPIYELFDTKVPAALYDLRERHSSTWHYHNNFYHGSLKMHGVDKRHACRNQNKGKLEPALLAIDRALSDKVNKFQEAILVAFAMHLLEDAHQPLHTTALVRADCSHDRGGNLYCLQKISGKCVMNLHQLWDRAFSVTSDRDFLNAIELGAAPTLPLSTEVALLLTKGEDLAVKVYETEENRMPHSYYFDWAKQTSKIQIERSIQRVAHYLKAHYERNKK